MFKEFCYFLNLLVCGNGIVEYLEECDDGYFNGIFNFNCIKICIKIICCMFFCLKLMCGDGCIDYFLGEECDDGEVNNGKDYFFCMVDCKCKSKFSMCVICNLNLFFNKCIIIMFCIFILFGLEKNYCVCWVGYRVFGLVVIDLRQFRFFGFVGQEYRVFVVLGVECDQFCDSFYLGLDSCREVFVRVDCVQIFGDG